MNIVHHTTDGIETLHILLVEDAEIQACLVSRKLVSGSLPVRVTVARTLAEARACLREFTPALAIIDLVLPDGKGTELLRPGQGGVSYPVVVMTSHGDEQAAVEALKAGALDYVVKSAANLSDLPRIIARALREWKHIGERRRAEEALRESEARYRSLFESAGDAILTLREGLIVHCNKKATDLFRCSAEGLIGRRVEDFSPLHQADGNDSAARACAKLDQALAGFTQVFDWRHRGADGSLFDTEISLTRMEFQGNTDVLAIIRDVTERKRAEEALKISETEKTLILNSTLDLVVYHDRDMKILWGNRRALESAGIEPQALTERHCWEIWHQRDQICEGCPVILARDTGEPQESEMCTPDGRKWHIRGFPVKDENQNVKGVVEFCLDITERKRAERALWESEEKFATAFRANPSILVISTVEEGRYIEVNESFEQILGYRREEAIGRTSLDLNIWESPEARDRFLHVLHTDGRVREMEAHFRNKRGERLIGLLSADVMEIKGEPCLLILVNDISERKRMEEEIALLNANLSSYATELEASNRELEAFNYSVSHDLRSPLTGVSGFCQVLLDRYGDRLDDPCREFVRQIYQSAQDMDELITTMLNFACISRHVLTRESVDLSGLASQVSCQLRVGAPQREVEFIIAQGVKSEGDGKLLRIVLENLIGNAWKYTARQPSARIEFGTLEIDSSPVYFVRDNGPGFDMAHADKLFRPFQRLPGGNSFAGHGIGLATVQRIIHYHGGRVWGEGAPGAGATFYFTL